jgi:copper chaperone CopZ
LERLPGVKRADVRLETEEARVIYDDSKQTPEKLAVAIDQLGFRASVLSVTVAPKPTLYVDGVTNLKAAQKVEQVLKALKGVRGVMVDPRDGAVFVESDGQAMSPHDWILALNAASFRARMASP